MIGKPVVKRSQATLKLGIGAGAGVSNPVEKAAFSQVQRGQCGIPATAFGTMLRCRPKVWKYRVLFSNFHEGTSRESQVRAAPNRGIGLVMAVRKSALILLVGLMLGGCVHATLEPTTDANFTPRDKKLLANAPYAQATIPQAYQRHIVDYHRAEAPGSIVVDSDARYLYYVLAQPQGDPLRRDRRRRRAVVLGRRAGRAQGRVAVVDSDRRHQAPHAGRSGSRRRRRRTIRSAPAASICSRATATRCSASTAPTSRNISGRRSPRAASA